MRFWTVNLQPTLVRCWAAPSTQPFNPAQAGGAHEWNQSPTMGLTQNITGAHKAILNCTHCGFHSTSLVLAVVTFKADQVLQSLFRFRVRALGSHRNTIQTLTTCPLGSQ